MRPEIPAELHALATAPALPATPAALVVGRGMNGAPKVQLFGPFGGHTILDLYFCAVLPGLLNALGSELLEGNAPIPMDLDSELDATTALGWRLAISAVRTRPNTGEVPAGIPKGGL